MTRRPGEVTVQVIVTNLELAPCEVVAVTAENVPTMIESPVRIEFEAPLGRYQIGDRLRVTITPKACTL